MAAAGVRDWAELLPELLGSISERLSLIDYFRFDVVCTSWAAAARASSLDEINLKRPPTMPFLLHVGVDGESCTLVSLHDRRHHHMGPLPEIRDKYIIGSQDGWIGLLDIQSEASLFNPLTRTHIRLPSVTTIPDIDPVYNPDGSLKAFINHDDCDLHYTPSHYRNITFKKIAMSSRPTTTGNYAVMAIFSSYSTEAILTTTGGDKWIVFQEKWGFTDVIYRDGNFLFVADMGDTWAVDATAPSPKMRMFAKGVASFQNEKFNNFVVESYDKFLVESSGDLLQVWTREGNLDYTMTFIVMKFNPDQSIWVPLKSLGDRSVFLGICYSMSASAQEIPELKPNSIYFTQMLWDWISEKRPKERTMTRFVGVFNMEDETIDHYCPLDPRLNWPLPLYFTPSLL